jgi:hypothetical protein
MWDKKGLVFVPRGQYEWMQTHASNPVAVYLEGDVYRILFSTRNKYSQSQVGFIDVNVTWPHEILNISEKPVLGLGKLGYFDCDGVYAGVRGMFYSSIGLAISEDRGLTFNRVSEAPILSRDEIDKWAVMAPFVLQESDIWRMWYASGIKVYHENEKLMSYYDIKYAESEDGIKWKKTGISSIELGSEDSNIARPCVVKEGDLYRVWYPVVRKGSKEYRIGYGESTDGIHFTRMDHLAPIRHSDSGWDSRSVTYPYVFRHRGKYYMLYNGNDFGKDGFGLAVGEA